MSLRGGRKGREAANTRSETHETRESEAAASGGCLREGEEGINRAKRAPERKEGGAADGRTEKSTHECQENTASGRRGGKGEQTRREDEKPKRGQEDEAGDGDTTRRRDDANFLC